MTLWVDPPDGWKYGFPKPVPKDREHDLLEWIFEQGYPRPTSYPEDAWVAFLVRCWREEDNDTR